MSIVKRWLKVVVRCIVDLNWKIAITVWKYQSIVIRYLTSNDGKSVVLSCGIAGVLYPKYLHQAPPQQDVYELWQQVKSSPQDAKKLLDVVRKLKHPEQMFLFCNNTEERQKFMQLAEEIRDFVSFRVQEAFRISSQQSEKETQENLWLLDSAWCIEQENLQVIDYIIDVFPEAKTKLEVFTESLAIVSVLRGLDKKLETRGRDSCGLSIMFRMEKEQYQKFCGYLHESFDDDFHNRQLSPDLKNYALDVHTVNDDVVVTFTYKVAKAIGQLGDNVAHLRNYIQGDEILHVLLGKVAHEFCSAIVHTRWASQGIVSIENCHPVDNQTLGNNRGYIYAVLNGDIDNYADLRSMCENGSQKISDQITTDAKIIPLIIDKFLGEGHNLEEAFCQAVNLFNGSFAIEMHSSLAPGKIYLAQQGKGQGLYVGLSDYGYHIASEIYGFVEQTADYIAMEPGQIVVLDQNSDGGLKAIKTFDRNGKEVPLQTQIAQTPITTRDVFLDTSRFQHFLQKEIHEAPQIIQKTLNGRLIKTQSGHITTNLGNEILPQKIRDKLREKKYRYVYFVGMGTAHAAGEAIAATFANILHNENNELIFSSLLATEFMATYSKKDRHNTLVIGISQSGGTTDTNAAIRKFLEDKADVLGIINKRDSDMSFLVDGVLYTGDGRDVEIAVASTKAFYAQVIAGTLYALEISKIFGFEDEELHEIAAELLEIPGKLETLFARREQIAKSANELAPKHVYWDTLSTGIGKPVARELKIKLSELCYMSIPSFTAANKKHINLSAEALILCFLGAVDFSGALHQGSLAKDLRGEIAIFLAQSNVPVVITTENDITYDDVIPPQKQPYQLLKVIPEISPTFAVIMNTAAGHLWAYYAAEALNKRSLFFAQILDDINRLESMVVDEDSFPIQILQNKDFQKCLREHYENYKNFVENNCFNNGLLAKDIAELEKLFLLVLQIIPVTATPFLFNENWSSEQILQEFKSKLTYLRTWLCRSIDAIKHQAKYITVGVTGFEGITDMAAGELNDVFQSLLHNQLLMRYEEDVNEYDLITLSNVQRGIKVVGGLLYNVYHEDGDVYLETIGESMFGDSQGKTSRYMDKMKLRGGRKAIAIKHNKVNIGKGQNQENTIIIPLRSLGKISKILLCRFDTNENLEALDKIALLGGLESKNSKATEIFVTIQENREDILTYYRMSEDITDDNFLATVLDKVTVRDLLLLPHEDISEKIIAKVH
ncbi:SIS domain-containing protein [Candidatus Uabimicrobium amorphum]|uniref:Glutamine--fructose-6-phosphate aminotransferase [isomerizing] n=1 Tax=Uabimicrobium amorphum TaxID=2596890 RepID=A0A5S9F256_UABAM|nr:SIS domain-containing protein [Candidatus Uabimicrobium amorphum]BBM81762.1 glutamine--fructose-6-phosphate aminotransferase[isomerizing] [Candidatus Uabimicrobium amorphum]